MKSDSAVSTPAWDLQAVKWNNGISDRKPKEWHGVSASIQFTIRESDFALNYCTLYTTNIVVHVPL